VRYSESLRGLRASRLTACDQSLTVMRLLADERKPLEERHDARAEIWEAIHLPVAAAVAGGAHRPAAESLAEEIERRSIVL
jgi:hypothetical protein